MFYTVAFIILADVQSVPHLASEVLFISAPFDMILEVFDNFLVFSCGKMFQVHPVYFLP